MDRSYEDSAIDKNNLDEECLVAPAQFDYWATKEAEAANARDLLKDQVDILKVDLDDAKAKAELEIRGLSTSEINKIFSLNLDTNGSLTVGAVNSVMLSHPNVVAAKQKYRDKCEALRVKSSQTAIFHVGCKSIEKKMIMIDILCKLHGQGYFSKLEGKKFRGLTLEALKKRVAETIKKDRAQKLLIKKREEAKHSSLVVKPEQKKAVPRVPRRMGLPK